MSKFVKSKRPPGRPKIKNPASEKLPVVRVTPDQLATYRKTAQNSGQTFSSWTRNLLSRNVFIPKTTVGEFYDLWLYYPDDKTKSYKVTVRLIECQEYHIVAYTSEAGEGYNLRLNSEIKIEYERIKKIKHIPPIPNNFEGDITIGC